MPNECDGAYAMRPAAREDIPAAADERDKAVLFTRGCLTSGWTTLIAVVSVGLVTGLFAGVEEERVFVLSVVFGAAG